MTRDSAVTQVTFLGTDSAVPSCGGDTASFVINGKYLVDTGWCAALKMKCFGIDPSQLEYLIFTHCHHDHYIGLPQLLFHLAMRAKDRQGRAPLKIIGPAGEIENVVRLAQQFLQTDRFPPVKVEIELIPLHAGDRFEEDRFTLKTCATVHPVPGLCYRFMDKQSGREIGFTGDTAYDPAVVRNVRGVQLLIHDASYGPSSAPKDNPWGHSGAPEAARVAAEAEVGRLALIHCSKDRQQPALWIAQMTFPNTIWPSDGETVEVE